jgi:hypothetical protein
MEVSRMFFLATRLSLAATACHAVFGCSSTIAQCRESADNRLPNKPCASSDECGQGTCQVAALGDLVEWIADDFDGGTSRGGFSLSTDDGVYDLIFEGEPFLGPVFVVGRLENRTIHASIIIPSGVIAAKGEDIEGDTIEITAGLALEVHGACR